MRQASSDGFRNIDRGFPEVEIGRITGVVEKQGVPIGLYEVRTRTGRQLRNVPALLPFCSYSYQDPTTVKDGSTRAIGGSGMLPIVNRGDLCLIVLLAGKDAHRQAFILGFFAPIQESGGAAQNQRRIRPGSLQFVTPYGNGLTIFNGGGLEIVADAACQRLMTPMTAESTDELQAMIADLCRNYVLQTAAGEIVFGEAGSGKSALRMRVYELSRWSDPAARKASGDRFVEIQYGAVKEGGLFRMHVKGDNSVVVAADAMGGWSLVADTKTSEVVAEVVQITADASGRTVVTPQATYQVTGSVMWSCLLFELDASLTQLNGVVMLNGGGRPGARIGDSVDLDTGLIITGDPRFLH